MKTPCDCMAAGRANNMLLVRKQLFFLLNVASMVTAPVSLSVTSQGTNAFAVDMSSYTKYKFLLESCPKDTG